MTKASSLPARSSPDACSSRRTRLAAMSLASASILYAAAAAAWLPHTLALGDAIDVFTAGALPGLLVTVLLWSIRPGAFERRHRLLCVGISLSAPAAVALAPLALAGL